MAELVFSQLLAPVNVGAIANYTARVGMYAFALSNTAIVCVADFGPTSTKYFSIYVVDISGAVTVYTTGQLSPYANIASITPFGSGNFLIVTNTGQNFWVRVANLKLNNASSPILIHPSNVPISNSCYQTNPVIFYDSTHQFLGAGFYDAAEEGGTVSSSTYSVNPITGTLSLIAEGYVGAYTEGYDPWDQTSSAEFPSPSFSGLASNGLFIAQGNYPPHNDRYIGQQSFDVNAGVSLGCDTPNGAYVKTLSSELLLTALAGVNTIYLGDTNISGLTVFEVEAVGLYALGADNVLYEESYSTTLTGGQTGLNPENLVLTPDYLFCFGSWEVGMTTQKGGVAVTDNPGWQAIPPNYKVVHNVVNNARPISLTGRFAA